MWISGLFALSRHYPRMKSPTELLEQIIRAETALHVKLVAQRAAGKPDIGGRAINDLIEEVDQGLSSAERMLVFFKNEDAAKIMLADAGGDELGGS